MSAATRSATRSARSRRAPDRLCAEAVELAREAVEEAADPGTVGEWIEAVADDPVGRGEPEPLHKRRGAVPCR